MSWLVQTRALGKRKPLLDDFSIDPPSDLSDGDGVRLRDVIEHVVRQEVYAFQKRQQARRFDRVLTEAQVAKGAARGKVDPASKNVVQPVDLDEATATALLAFEDGLYIVVIDEKERRSLDEQVLLRPDSRITFIRLTFLAGA